MTTPLSRMSFTHPAQGTAGDASLYAAIETIYQSIGDAMPARYGTQASLANGATWTATHGLKLAFSELTVKVYTYDGSGNLTRLTTGFTAVANGTNPTTQIDITNSTGSTANFAALVLQVRAAEKLADLSDVNPTGAQDGQALVYNAASSKFLPGASGDATMKLQSVTTPNLVLKGGNALILDDGRELATWNGGTTTAADFGADLTLNLTTILGSSPANATTYYLYVDLNSLSASVLQSDTGRKVFAVQQANFALLTTAPDLANEVRYVPVGYIRSATTGTAWSGTGSAFGTLGVRRHTLRTLNTGNINYIATGATGTPNQGNHNAESGLTSFWTSYNDASAAPPTGALSGALTSGNTFTASSTSPLRGNYSFLFAKTGAASLGDGVAFPFTIDAADKSKLMRISFDYLIANLTSTYATGDIIVSIVDVTNSTTIVPSTTQLAAGGGTFNATFLSTTSTSYRLHLHVDTSTTATFNLRFDNLAVGPNVSVLGAAISDWQSYTPTVSPVSTGYSVSPVGYYRRVGDSIELFAGFQTSASTPSGTITISLPAGLAIDTTKVSTALDTKLGDAVGYKINADTGYNYGLQVVKASGSTTTLNILKPGTTTVLNGTDLNTGSEINVHIVAPIATWTSNVTLASSRVEFASNTGGEGSAAGTQYSNATYFVNGPAGSQFANIGSSTTGNQSTQYRVRFQSPIQPTDAIQLEIYFGGVWGPVANSSVISGFTYQNTANYGMGWEPINGNTTDVYVDFGNGGRNNNSTSYGAAGTSWSGISGNPLYLWRVRKSSGIGAGELTPVTATNSGYLTTGADTIAGAKTFNGAIDAAGGFTADTAAYATASVPGIVSTVAQTLGGTKTLSVAHTTTATSTGANQSIGDSASSAQYITPSAPISFTLDNTFTAGREIKIFNLSSTTANIITVKSNSGTTIRQIYPGTEGVFVAKISSPSAATDWLAVNLVYSVYASFTPSWTNWAPTGTNGGYYRRVGSLFECEVFAGSGGAAPSGIVTLNMPASLSIDTARMPSATAAAQRIGTCEIYNGTNIVDAVPYVASSSQIQFNKQTTAFVAYTTGDTVAQLNLKFTLPITGWSEKTG